MATTEAAADSQPVTPDLISTVSGLRTMHYWLDCIHKRAAIAKARNGCDIVSQSTFGLIEEFAERGLVGFHDVNNALIRKALEG